MEEEAGGEYTVQAGHQGLHRAALLPHTQHKVLPEIKKNIHIDWFTLFVGKTVISYVFGQENGTGFPLFDVTLSY